MVYEPRLSREYAAEYSVATANAGPEVLNPTITAAAEVEVLANTAGTPAGEYPQNLFELDWIASGWIAAEQEAGW